MSKMIGRISGRDWSEAPEGATHCRLTPDYCGPIWYRSYEGLPLSLYPSWSTGKYEFISKEEDLGMGEKEVTKQVRSVDDLEVGMFIRWNSYPNHHYVVSKPKQIISFNTGEVYNYGKDSCWTDNNFYTSSWSYTYNGEYTPIVKDTVETEAGRKIKELEETIELAQKQLREYKEMK